MIQDPYLDGGLHGWIHNTARKNYRRVAGYTFNDMVQEGYLVFWKCKSRYVGKGTVTARGVLMRALPEIPDEQSRKHFMSLVQRALSNRIQDLVAKQPVGRELPIADMLPYEQRPNDDVDLLDKLLPSEDEVASVTDLIRTAPREVLQLLDLLISDLCDARPRRRFGKGRLKTRETNARYWGRLLGLPLGVDVEAELERHFLRQ